MVESSFAWLRFAFDEELPELVANQATLVRSTDKKLDVLPDGFNSNERTRLCATCCPDGLTFCTLKSEWSRFGVVCYILISLDIISVLFWDVPSNVSHVCWIVIHRKRSDVFQEDRSNSVTIGVADDHIGLVVGRGGRNVMEISQVHEYPMV